MHVRRRQSHKDGDRDGKKPEDEAQGLAGKMVGDHAAQNGADNYGRCPFLQDVDVDCASCLAWARSEAIEVGMIVSSDVPTAV